MIRDNDLNYLPSFLPYKCGFIRMKITALRLCAGVEHRWYNQIVQILYIHVRVEIKARCNITLLAPAMRFWRRRGRMKWQGSFPGGSKPCRCGGRRMRHIPEHCSSVYEAGSMSSGMWWCFSEVLTPPDVHRSWRMRYIKARWLWSSLLSKVGHCSSSSIAVTLLVWP